MLPIEAVGTAKLMKMPLAFLNRVSVNKKGFQNIYQAANM